MIVYITRHGQPLIESAEEADPEYPRHDPPLTTLGRLQASALGRRLRQAGFGGRIYASPYRRTVETAELIAEELDCCHTPEPAIREIVKQAEQMEGFVGLAVEALRAEYPRVAPDASLPKPWWTPEAETDDQVLDRVAPFLQRLIGNGGGDALLVGHGASVQAVTRWFLERCRGVPMEMPLSWNCALTAFQVGEACEVLFLRDTTHLLDDQVTSNARRKVDGEADAGEPQ